MALDWNVSAQQYSDTTHRQDTRIACLSVYSCFFLLEVLTSWQGVRHRFLGIAPRSKRLSPPSSILDYDVVISKACLFVLFVVAKQFALFG